MSEMTVQQNRFLERWTWFDAEKCKVFMLEGRADEAGEWARSAVHDVLSDELFAEFARYYRVGRL